MTLELYYRASCPFCLKVLAFMKDNNIEITLKDISATSDVRNDLIRIGGKQQVPCLVIDGKPLYESDDIINWLKENYK
ncbi:MAG: glutaredoxin 3 [Lysobacterales bacterium]|jgi:glutaredoxin 3